MVEELTPQKAFLSLVANTFATNTLDNGMRAKEFEILSRLAPRVPIRALYAHQDSGRLGDLCDLLSDSTKKLHHRNPPLRGGVPVARGCSSRGITF